VAITAYANSGAAERARGRFHFMGQTVMGRPTQETRALLFSFRRLDLTPPIESNRRRWLAWSADFSPRAPHQPVFAAAVHTRTLCGGMTVPIGAALPDLDYERRNRSSHSRRAKPPG